ncbi:hypothetical protein BLNAU_24837 [Blattamonas nauphoetae]|uniref:Uncharacterized protein n=1 Tax=Blattamonas nauphoetae TaxID=2049346 RepID=A0ABQ9WLB7_9EUKA|nr:hypothetical protein BLNAU_24837 [Blattamonas nauphoetae]
MGDNATSTVPSEHDLLVVAAARNEEEGDTRTEGCFDKRFEILVICRSGVAEDVDESPVLRTITSREE